MMCRAALVLALAIMPGAGMAQAPCLVPDQAEVMSCLQEAVESCLSTQGGGAGYRACLEDMRQDVSARMDEAANAFQDDLMFGLGARYAGYFVVEHALWKAWRDQTCETRAFLEYQTGTAAASAILICHLMSDARRWHDLMHSDPLNWQGP